MSQYNCWNTVCQRIDETALGTSLTADREPGKTRHQKTFSSAPASGIEKAFSLAVNLDAKGEQRHGVVVGCGVASWVGCGVLPDALLLAALARWLIRLWISNRYGLLLGIRTRLTF